MRGAEIGEESSCGERRGVVYEALSYLSQERNCVHIYIYIRRDSRRRCTHPIYIHISIYLSIYLSIYIYKPERETLQGMIERSRRPVTTTGSSLGSGCVLILRSAVCQA